MNTTLAKGGVDTGPVRHYGNPVTEAYTIGAGDTVVDLSGRNILKITGAGRLGWSHSLTSQRLESLGARESLEALVLSPSGHTEHVLAEVNDGTWIPTWTEPGRIAALMDFLTSIRFTMRVEIRPRDDLQLVWVGDDVEVSGDWARRPTLGGCEMFRPVDVTLPGDRPVGI